jgi:hypothetical protein
VVDRCGDDKTVGRVFMYRRKVDGSEDHFWTQGEDDQPVVVENTIPPFPRWKGKLEPLVPVFEGDLERADRGDGDDRLTVDTFPRLLREPVR